MFPITSTRRLSKNGALSAFLLLAACGGGEQGPARQTNTEFPQSATPAAEPSAAAQAPALAGDPAAAATTDAQLAQAAESAALALTESIALAASYTPLVQGTINAQPYWPVWWGTGKPVDGVNCLINSTNHHHALISIYKDGKRLGFPDGIGRVHAGCYHAYEMHVHDVTGIIHMETDVPKSFKLGQWFSLWGQPLSRNNVAGLAGPVRYYIIEKGTITRYDGNPYDIAMLPHREVLIVTGTVLSVVPKYLWPLGI